MPVVSRKVLRTTEGLAGGLIVILWIKVVFVAVIQVVKYRTTYRPTTEKTIIANIQNRN